MGVLLFALVRIQFLQIPELVMLNMFIKILSVLVSLNTRAGSARAPLRLCSGLSTLTDPGSHL